MKRLKMSRGSEDNLDNSDNESVDSKEDVPESENMEINSENGEDEGSSDEKEIENENDEFSKEPEDNLNEEDKTVDDLNEEDKTVVDLNEENKTVDDLNEEDKTVDDLNDEDKTVDELNEKDKTVDDLNEEDKTVDDLNEEEKPEDQEEKRTFKDLGVIDVLCEACEKLKWSEPTKIQKEAIPLAIAGRDVIGLAETGSGKTAAFALPILQALLEHPQRYFALILTPTRELAFQISEQFEALGSGIGVKSAVIVGGMDMMSQAMMLAKKPHILIATPGRLVDHLENTKGFSLKSLKYLVMDEADRILNMDFEIEVDKILRVIPRERHTFLFSATMTKKVQKLQRASLRNPVKVEVSTKYKTVEKLQQYYIFIPMRYKDVYLVYLLNEMAGNSFMIFCATCNGTMKTALMLRNLGMSAIPLNGQMSQNKRLAALTKFRAKSRTALISTDVASRGLDIPHVDVVINLDIPTHSKDYIHRVGRTARAGRSGIAVTFVTQYDVELYQRIEHLIGKQLPKFETKDEEVMLLEERVGEAKRTAVKQIRDMEDVKGRKRKRPEVDNGFEDDTETALGIRKRKFGNNKNKMKKKFGKRKK